MTQKALRFALEALDNLMYWDNGKSEYDEARDAIIAIKEALAQLEQDDGMCTACENNLCTAKQGCVALDTPPQRTWVGLTDEEIEKCYETTGHYQTLRPQDRFAVFALSRAIEAKLKEKNT